jgi:hypothetical protein
MAKILRSTVDSKIQNGFEFQFSKYLSDGFNLIGKDFGQFVLFAFLSFLIACVSVITIIGPTVVLICTLNGFAVAADKIERNEKVELNDFFKGFDKLGNKIVLALIYFGITLLLYIPMIFSLISMGYFSGTIGDGVQPVRILFMVFSYVFFYGGILILHSSLVFSSYLIHFGDYSAGEAVSKSFRLYKKNFWMTTIFVLVMGILAYVGMAFCVIGIFASFPIMGLAYYSLIKDSLLSGEYSEIEQIGGASF